jgi:DnaK suppressor protein
MSDALTLDQKQQLKVALQGRRAALADRRSDYLDGHSRAEHARELLLQDGDDATQRDAEREVDFARTDRDAVALAEIDQALSRLGTGQYGLCTDCGDDIPLARLQSAPQVTRCIECESRIERSLPRPPTL